MKALQEGKQIRVWLDDGRGVLLDPREAYWLGEALHFMCKQMGFSPLELARKETAT